MANKRGRPPIDDLAALRRVAEYLAAAEENGTPCSTRAAILRTSAGASGNSQDAVLWRLQRKWRRRGAALLAAAKEHRAPRRYVTSVPMRGGLLGSAFDEIAHTLQARRAEVQLVTGRLAALHDDATAALRSLDQFKLAAERERAALGVALRLREQIGRMGDYDREIMRARRTFEELMGIRRA